MNILVLMGEVAYISRSEYLKGIVSKAQTDKNNIFLFTCEGFAFHELSAYSEGEYEIYKLPHLQNYDAIIVDFNSIHHQPTLDYLREQIVASGVPCVSFNEALKGASRITCLYDKQFEELIEHLIIDHGFRDIHYMSGPKLDEQSLIRQAIFEQTMHKHQLEVLPENIHIGDFNLGSGRMVAGQYMEQNRKIPDAFVCANDYMAIGLIEGFKSYGIRCPEDFAVVGVDNSHMGKMMVPRMSTIDMCDYAFGQKAYEAAVQLAKGERQPGEIHIHGKKVIGHSCGCDCNVDSTYIGNECVKIGAQMDQSLDLIKSLNLHFNDVKTLIDFERAVSPFVEKLGIEYFYYCQCGNRESYYQELEMFGNGTMDVNDRTTYHDYDDNAWCPIACEKGEWSSYSAFDCKQLLPFECIKEEGVYYIIMPVHRNRECIGYAVMGNFDWSLSGRVLQHLILEFDRAIGSIRQNDITKSIMANINKRWQYDELTEIYNRSGFYHQMQFMISQAKKEEKGITISFFDLDGLKKINDLQGHKAGDRYIVKMATALKELGGREGIVARFGGDEFLMATIDASSEEGLMKAEAVKNKINEAVSVSVGSVYGVLGSIKELNLLIRKADKKMYQDKVARKAER